MSIHRRKATTTQPKRKAQPEYDLQCSIADYLRRRHPSVLFNSDIKGSVKLTMPQAARMKKLYCNDFAMPDVIILEPRFDKGKAGLCLEIKIADPFKKNGELKKNEHLERQYMAIKRLRERGFDAHFIWSMDQAVHVIEGYLG